MRSLVFLVVYTCNLDTNSITAGDHARLTGGIKARKLSWNLQPDEATNRGTALDAFMD
jgi:hypothetical protein